MKKRQVVKLNEKQLNRIIKESVNAVLGNYGSNGNQNNGQAMANAFANDFNQNCVRFLAAAWENCNGDTNAMWNMIMTDAKLAFQRAYLNRTNFQS